MTETSARNMSSAPDVSGGMVRVWDPLIRTFHWSLVAAFAVAYLSAEDLSTVHEIAGYAVAGLIAFRLIWGLVGSKYARFSQFLRGSSHTIRYMGEVMRGTEQRYLGHNPAGAIMTVALLLTLAGTAFTGWLLKDEGRVAMLPELPQIVTPAYADGDDERNGGRGSEALEEAHEVLANLMLFLIAVHVGGVVLTSFRHRENLVRAMVTGQKCAPDSDDMT